MSSVLASSSDTIVDEMFTNLANCCRNFERFHKVTRAFVLLHTPLDGCLQFWRSCLRNVPPRVARPTATRRTSCFGDKSRVARPYTSVYSIRAWDETDHGRSRQPPGRIEQSLIMAELLLFEKFAQLPFK